MTAFLDSLPTILMCFVVCAAKIVEITIQSLKTVMMVKGERFKAAALGFLAVHNMDKVSFHFMKGEKAENPFGTMIGKNAFFRAMGTFDSLEFADDVDIEKCVTNTPDMSTNNGLTVIISDFFTESNWKKAVDYFKKVV